MLAPSLRTSGPTSSPPRCAVSSAVEQRMGDGEVEVGVRVRFVGECVMPPLAFVGAKTAGVHERAKASPVLRLDLREASCSMMRDRIHQVIVTAHTSKFTGRQVVKRQVDGAAPTVTRLHGHISLL